MPLSSLNSERALRKILVSEIMLVYIIHIFSLTYFITTNTNASILDAEDISLSPTVFESRELPRDNDGRLLKRYMASVGNGHIATEVFTDVVFMNGLYNGFKGESHRAAIPSRNNIRIFASDTFGHPIQNLTFGLDVEKGLFFEKFIIGNFQVEGLTFAHRYYHKVMVNQIRINLITPEPSQKLTLNTTTSYHHHESEDILFEPEIPFDSIEAHKIPSKYQCGRTIQVEDPRYQNMSGSGPNICIVYAEVPSSIETSTNETFTYFAAYDKTFGGAVVDFKAVASLISLGHHDEVLKKHIESWKNLWKFGRIEVEGNLHLSKVVYGCMYYIMSSVPLPSFAHSTTGQFYGLSPTGLAYGSAYQDAQGHVFWDQEIWLFPILVSFFPEMAREVLNNRLRGTQPARDKAKSMGYRGVQFPWESGKTGRDITPECCQNTVERQIHITGDVAFAIRQYISITRDIQWLKEIQDNHVTNGCGLIREIAEFWISRAKYNEKTKFHDINGCYNTSVMPPDSDHDFVDNDVFTNVVAGYAIFFAKYAECLCNGSMEPIPEKWIDIAKSIKLPYDPRLNFHPEFDGYILGDLIKQADAVLLGYPLLYRTMTSETRKNDLNIYGNVTRQNGPGMTWAMHTIGNLELNDLKAAEELFNRSYQTYMREPFKIWTEAQPPTLGSVNYITGMGGFLQAVLSGYGGYRLHSEKLVFIKPRVLPNSKSLKFIGLNFLDNVFDISIYPDMVKVSLTRNSTKFPLTVQCGYDCFTFVEKNAEITLRSRGLTITFGIDSSRSHCPLPFDQINIPYENVASLGKNLYIPLLVQQIHFLLYKIILKLI